MGRNKKKKFAEVKTFSNVIQWDDENSTGLTKSLLKKHSRVVLELGCGKGEYSNELGVRYPDTLFVGIDIQGERIWRGAKNALENNLENVHFLRIQIDNILEYIPKKSVDEIWITFPDPFPPERQSKKRLTAPKFLEKYKKILKKKGVVHLKTDSEGLYRYTKDVINELGLKIDKDIVDVYVYRDLEDITDIQTTFEKKHLSEQKEIKYLRFSFN